MAEPKTTAGVSKPDTKPDKGPKKIPKPLEFSFPVEQESAVKASFKPMPRSFRQERSAQIFAVRLCRMLELSPNSITVVYSKFMQKYRVYAEI